MLWLCLSAARAEVVLLSSSQITSSQISSSQTSSPQNLFDIGVIYRAKGQDVPALATLREFKKTLLRVPRIDLRGGRYWLNVKVQAQGNINDWALGRVGSYIEKIELFVFDESSMQHAYSGQFYQHDYPLHAGADLKLTPGKTYDVWVLYESRYFTGVPTAYIFPKHDFAYEVLLDNLLIIACLGSIVILALYNLLLSIWTQSKDYLYYSLYLLMTFIGWAAVFKVFAQTLNITHPALIIIPFYLNIVTNTLFYRYFLGLDGRYRWLCQYGNAVAIAAFLLAAGHFLLPLWTNYLLINLLTGFWLAGGLTAGLLRWRDGYKPARFYNMGFVCMTLGGALVVLPFLGLPRITQKEYLITLVAQTLDVLFLAIALADRINIMRQEKANALQYAREVDQKATQALLMANQKLHDALKISEENQRQKDQFVMAISHELRTPLNAISASLGQLADTKEEKEQQLLHQFIQFGADRLSTQVENLIMLAETDQQKIRPHSRLFHVESLLQRIRRLAEGYLFNKPVAFFIERSSDQYACYRGDDYLLIRLLIPVLENACKFTERGHVRLTLMLSTHAIDFCFEDSGAGIDTEMQKHLFESFTQASTGYRRTHEGLGIGFSVCQRIARLMDATLRIESEDGKGTRFFLQVPLQAETSAYNVQTVQIEGHALIVEDNEVNAKVLNALLKKIGFTTEVAANGLLALDKVKEQNFDVVLMDLQMPVMDGFASAQAMRKLGVHCPIVAVTANSDYEARMKCFDVGMNDLLTKPLNKEVLQEKLSYWMQAG